MVLLLLFFGGGGTLTASVLPQRKTLAVFAACLIISR